MKISTNNLLISKNLLKSVRGYICLSEVLALDEVYLHKNKYNKTFSVCHYYFCFTYLLNIRSN